MPFTFLAHQAFVVPLKWARPRWFDGTALCMGSMAPDLAYALMGTPWAFGSHDLVSQLTWSTPVAVGLTLCWRHLLALPCGAHLPGCPGAEIRALARVRRPVGLTAASALIGALSHVLVDGFTHPGGWAVERSELLRTAVLEGLTVARLLQYAGHTAGSAAGAAMLAVLLWRRQPTAWAEGPDRRPPPRPLSFWGPVVLGALLAGPAAATALHGGGLPAAVIRAAWTTFAGLVAGALLVRLRWRRSG